MGENAYCQIATNGFDNFNFKSMLSDGATAALFGALGGAGSGTKHLMSLGKQTVKRTCKAAYHRGLRAGFKEAKKAAVYYIKNTSKYYKDVFSNIPKDVFTSFLQDDFVLDKIKKTCYEVFEG